MFARVVSAVALPIPNDGATLNLTSVRVGQEERGVVFETAWFFRNDAVAPTLVKGDWIEYRGSRDRIADSLRLLQRPTLPLAAAKSVDEVLRALLAMYLKLADSAASKEHYPLEQGDVPVAVHHDLQYKAAPLVNDVISQTRKTFDTIFPLPDEVLLEKLPRQILILASDYLKVVGS